MRVCGCEGPDASLWLKLTCPWSLINRDRYATTKIVAARSGVSVKPGVTGIYWGLSVSPPSPHPHSNYFGSCWIWGYAGGRHTPFLASHSQGGCFRNGMTIPLGGILGFLLELLVKRQTFYWGWEIAWMPRTTFGKLCLRKKIHRQKKQSWDKETNG